MSRQRYKNVVLNLESLSQRMLKKNLIRDMTFVDFWSRIYTLTCDPFDKSVSKIYEPLFNFLSTFIDTSFQRKKRN